MFSYVPVLKAKKGEFAAVGNLDSSVREDLNPLWEIPPANGDRSALSSLRTRIADIFKVDPQPWIFPGYFSSDPGVWDAVRSALPSDDGTFKIIPVLKLPISVSSDLRVLVGQSQSVVVRLTTRELTGAVVIPDLLRQVAVQLEIDPEDIHLVADFGEVAHQFHPLTQRMLSEFLQVTEKLPAFQSITIAAGAFPESLSSLDSRSVNELERSDWDLYRAFAEEAVQRGIGFGDYGISGALMPKDVPFPGTPAVRYTGNSVWHVVKGDSATRMDFSQYRQLAADVMELDEWCGEEFSWGDLSIAKVARHELGTGNATNWRAYGTNHHLTFVVEQLASLPVA